MRELRIGDRVLTASALFSSVYFFGHRDADATAPFYSIATAANTTLRVTRGHYVPVSRGGCGSSTLSLTLAAELVRVGDGVLSGRGGTLGCARVVSIALAPARGIYNPYTLSGALVVDGVLASAHSEWLLEPALRRAGLSPEAVSRAAPFAYQTLFAPLRALFYALGAPWSQAAATAAGEATGFEGITLASFVRALATASV